MRLFKVLLLSITEAIFNPWAYLPAPPQEAGSLYFPDDY